MYFYLRKACEVKFFYFSFEILWRIIRNIYICITHRSMRKLRS